jgi:hypothetical protein
MTIPSAIRIIIETERDPDKQARMLNIFGLSGALGNGQCISSSNCVSSLVWADPDQSMFVVLGLVIAGVLELASWRWIFRFFR